MYFVFYFGLCILYFSRDGGEEALLMQFVFRFMYFVFLIMYFVFQQRWRGGGVTDAVCISDCVLCILYFVLCISAEMGERRRY